MKRKTTSIGLSEYTASRTRSALEQIDKAKQALRDQLASGELAAWLTEAKRTEVKESDVLRLTTLGPNFLNGDKHKVSTKPLVQAFLASLNNDLAELRRRGDAEQPSETNWRALYLEGLDRQERILTRVHGWKMTMIRLARENRELKKKLGVKVVSIRP